MPVPGIPVIPPTLPRAWACATAVLLMAPPAMAGSTASVTVSVVDSLGQSVAARVRVQDTNGVVHPIGPDEDLISRGSLGQHFYPDGPVTFDLPVGTVYLRAGRGFEWRAVELQVDVTADTLIQIQLDRPFDMRGRGWFSGDVHTHAKHSPIEYDITPERAHRLARAEDLSMLWCLDAEYEFTGGPHTLSDDRSVLYFTTEYRNQTFGHAALLGLETYMGDGCCWPDTPPSPTLTDLYRAWNPGPTQAMTLCHPHTTDDFWLTDAWPGQGLGREGPVLAALGTIDAFDLAAYSNVPNVHLDDWYAILNSGLTLPPSAGTDASLASYWTLPPGGYRLYVYEDQVPHGADTWVAALKSGRTFVSNYPLIPEFTVDDSPAGSTLVFSGDSTEVVVRARIECQAPLSSAAVMVNGEVAASEDLPGSFGDTRVDVEIPVTITESSWIALRVTGPNGSWHAVGAELLAHTGPVYVRRDGEAQRSPADAGPLLDWIDDLETLVLDRDIWDDDEQREAVLAQFEAARASYRDDFILPPGDFPLYIPGDGDTLNPEFTIVFNWADAIDPEPADRVTYRLTLVSEGPGAPDSLVVITELSQLTLFPWTLQTGSVYRWGVEAWDRAGNLTPSSPASQVFHTDSTWTVATDPAPSPPVAGIRCWPNPARRWVALQVPLGMDTRIRILDVQGREILAASGPGFATPGLSTTGERRLTWNTRDRRGRLVPSGRYWIEVIDRMSVGSPHRRVAPVMILR